ncbi:MAG: sugar phosphate nucleotidyltransferase [Thermoguttaceae bacterium]|jgi:glucose-1-phosphate thymidylyltransferase
MDKAVILARGLGTRMQRADAAAALDGRQAAMARSGLKAMIPIGRPFLDYVLSALAAAGYRRVCLVIGPEHDAVRDYYQAPGRAERLRLEFAVQDRPRGTADAVAAAATFAAADPVLVINSDNYYPLEALRALREQSGPAVAVFDEQSMLAGSNIPADRLQRFAAARIDAGGYMCGVLEKPDAAVWAALPRPIWLSMNCWRFGPAIFDACRAIGRSPRGELELTDAVQYAIDVLGERFRAVLVRQPVLDLTTQSDVAAVQARLAGVEVRF